MCFLCVLIASHMILSFCNFHFSGYDFGYLLKVLTNTNLPSEEQEFFEMLKLYFSNIYDVKYLMKSCKNLKGGLQEVSDQLEVRVHSVVCLSVCLSVCPFVRAITVQF